MDNPEKIVLKDLIPYFGARDYGQRNNLKNYSTSKIGDPNINESAATKQIFLHVWGVGILTTTATLAAYVSFFGLEELLN